MRPQRRSPSPAAATIPTPVSGVHCLTPEVLREAEGLALRVPSRPASSPPPPIHYLPGAGAMIKGAAIRSFMACYEGAHGQDAMRNLAARAPRDLAHLLDTGTPVRMVLAASWYPARLVHSMLDTATIGMSEAQTQRTIKEAVRTTVFQATEGVYGTFVRRLLTPDMYALAIPRLWRQVHSTGLRKMERTGATGYQSSVAKWTGHHPVLCGLSIEVMCAMFELMGKRDVSWNRESCVSRGDSSCVTRVSWRE
jgi:hypothetical protein